MIVYKEDVELIRKVLKGWMNLEEVAKTCALPQQILVAICILWTLNKREFRSVKEYGDILCKLLAPHDPSRGHLLVQTSKAQKLHRQPPGGAIIILLPPPFPEYLNDHLRYWNNLYRLYKRAVS